ncbi:MAG TPA: hypothetical protein VNY05_22265 [Candidatus Acidoferrales bacterium]|nr:hypothetical protein [Candidatus Acidoferrales bacterium]
MAILTTTDKIEALKRLRLFNEKAQELRSYSFIEKALHKDAGVEIHFDAEKTTLEAKRVGADNEARAAMCLVLRFFLQPRDGVELHQVADLYQTLPIKDEDKRLVCDNLKILDAFLDRKTEPELALNNNPITYGEIIETFLYGEQAHTNSDKRAVLETWKEIRPVYIVLENFFEYAVCETLRYILWLSTMNVGAIRALEQTT